MGDNKVGLQQSIQIKTQRGESLAFNFVLPDAADRGISTIARDETPRIVIEEDNIVMNEEVNDVMDNFRSQNDGRHDGRHGRHRTMRETRRYNRVADRGYKKRSLAIGFARKRNINTPTMHDVYCSIN